MRIIILRDDDTNALTPVECLEKLYRPFLDRGLPVNLAVIPEVRADVRMADGRREGFLRCGLPAIGETAPLVENLGLVDYLNENPGYHIAQHGCHHDLWEFSRSDRREIVRRLERGAHALHEAGFERPSAFVAPYDRFSPMAYEEVARRFSVISSGWFEWRRTPPAWRMHYLMKKFLRRPHWRVGRTLLLSHPGCLLSYTRSIDTMLDSIKAAVARQKVTVLVTHWWEYFRNGGPDEPYINVLHETAEWLASDPEVRVVSFDELAGHRRSQPKTEPKRASNPTTILPAKVFPAKAPPAA